MNDELPLSLGTGLDLPSTACLAAPGSALVSPRRMELRQILTEYQGLGALTALRPLIPKPRQVAQEIWDKISKGCL